MWWTFGIRICLLLACLVYVCVKRSSRVLAVLPAIWLIICLGQKILFAVLFDASGGAVSSNMKPCSPAIQRSAF